MNQASRMIRNPMPKYFLAALVAVFTLIWNKPLAAHCDTLDGPVVGAAR